MFAIVRDRYRGFRELFSAPRTRRRVRRLAGLFLFEFVVVVLGVLVAQMLQEEMADRREQAEAHESVARMRSEMSQFRGAVDYWTVAAPCLSRRMDRLTGSAASEPRAEARDFARPSLPALRISPLDEDIINAVRAEYGDALVYEYATIARATQNMNEYTHGIADEWMLLRLLDPAHREMTAEDRANARAAAMRIKGRLAALAVNSQNLREAFDRLRIPRTDKVIVSFDAQGACGQSAQ